MKALTTFRVCVGCGRLTAAGVRCEECARVHEQRMAVIERSREHLAELYAKTKSAQIADSL